VLLVVTEERERFSYIHFVLRDNFPVLDIVKFGFYFSVEKGSVYSISLLFPRQLHKHITFYALELQSLKTCGNIVKEKRREVM